jgi:RND family efflux transporter MFP subunit
MSAGPAPAACFSLAKVTHEAAERLTRLVPTESCGDGDVPDVARELPRQRERCSPSFQARKRAVMTRAAENEYRPTGETPGCAGHDHGSAAQRDRFMAAALWLFLLLLPLGAGCQKESPQAAEPTPVVPISHPVQRPVADYVDFTGRTDAVHSVNIVARVTGYLVQMPFAEGADVKKGDLLFQIDPQPYEAQVRLGLAQVATYDAQLQLAKKNFERVEILEKQKGISQQEFDQNKSAQDQAVAQLDAARANLEIYRLNLQYTRVTSPIDGQVSRYFLTLGNLINQDQTMLTTVVSLDPIYAFFDVDQRNLLRIRRAINEGKLPSRRASAPNDPQIPVLLGMPGEQTFPYKGTINFSNNQLNPNTGSIAVRGVFDNAKPANGVRLMSPGMFVRIRLPLGPPHPALLVIDRAIQSDQGQKYVYVVNAANKTEYRQVVTGSLEPDGLRAISSGLSVDDWVVVGAIQQLRPNMQVKTEQTTMPSFESTTMRR